jgi:nucleoside-diphosphate-sugar epimerase
LAGLAHAPGASVNPSDCYEINSEGVKRLASELAANGCKRFIFLSTVKTMGEFTLPGEYFSADTECSPIDIYGKSKLRAEEYLFDISRDTEMEVVVVRSPLVYGPGLKGNLQLLAKLLSLHLPLPLGSIKNSRSLVSIDNLIDLLALCCTHPAAANQIFLAADEYPVSTPELITALGSAIGKRPILFGFPVPVIKFIGSLLNKQDIVQKLCDNLALDIGKTKNLLGWSPPYQFQDAIKSLRE